VVSALVARALEVLALAESVWAVRESAAYTNCERKKQQQLLRAISQQLLLFTSVLAVLVWDSVLAMVLVAPD
jgi:uncharacterized membrane protein